MLHGSSILLQSLYRDPDQHEMCVCGQELFAKLTRIASISTDMFVGRERFATVLLMRLTETVILWLSDDQNFWGEIEQGPHPLGPLGLQQVNFH